MSVQIVVARYNENVNWLKSDSDNIIIYNKGESLDNLKNVISLPNVGREAHTYLYHIVNNYDTLADITIFTQAKIQDHGYLETLDALRMSLIPSTQINGFSNNFRQFAKGEYAWSDTDFNIKIRDLLIHSYKVPPYSVDKIVFCDWFKKFIDPIYPEKINMYQGAIFAVSKQNILRRSKEFYTTLLSELMYENAPIEAHFLERSWYYIFNAV